MDKTHVLEQYQGALLFSAIGDALGWPTEFLSPARRKPSFALPLRNFVSWPKRVGGRWWGYEDHIASGSYSDDTQLTLAAARSLSSSGDFEPEHFAYKELPLWLQYERGGGRTVKLAARTLLQRNVKWNSNFYRQKNAAYRQAGANGAAMRSLPIALVSACNTPRLIRDLFINAIITHGHPRAILGAMLFGLSVQFVLDEPKFNTKDLLGTVRSGMDDAVDFIIESENEIWIADWIRKWNGNGHASFRQRFRECLSELHQYIAMIPEFLEKPPAHYYQAIGALSPETKGSGLATVCAALFLSLREDMDVAERLYQAINLLGSDTDTIGSILGALLGARYGVSAVPSHLCNQVQDHGYLSREASRLYAIARDGSAPVSEPVGNSPGKQEFFQSIRPWEDVLQYMFSNAKIVGKHIVHPTMQQGIIVDAKTMPISREGYVAKLIHVDFDCGQTCVFHSRVDAKGKVAASLAQEIDKVLRPKAKPST